MDNEGAKVSLLNWLCWLISAVAMAGSLFFSEVLEYPPCSLCWYQRIAMYPLVIIFLIGANQVSKVTISFSAPFVLIGWGIALYHNLLQFGIIPEGASPCREGIPCAINYIEWLGFITIPMLSFTAFTLIGILLFAILKNSGKESNL